MAVRKKGGVAIGRGNAAIGQPSAAGEWRRDLDAFDVPFDRDKFTRAIHAKGYDVIWEKAQYCPDLRGPSPHSHDITCETCKNGFLYFDPIQTRMLMTGLTLPQQFYAYGRFTQGKVSVTAMPEFKVSYWDRITVCDARLRAQEHVRRQVGTMSDRLQYAPISAVRLSWKSPTVVKQAIEGVDFDCDCTEGTLVWKTDNRPDNGQFYSIVYYHQPSYIVLDNPHAIRDQHVPRLDQRIEKSYEFPVQVIAQLDTFIRDNGTGHSDEGNSKNPFPPKGSSDWPGT